MKMHLQATENLPNAKFSRGVVPLGRGSKNAEAGWKLRRRKICSRCLREDKLVRQMITFWHDQGGKCNANKTRMKQMNWRNLPSCVPFILLVCLSTTDHTTQEDKATAGSTCRREAHLMPSYPDPAPRSPQCNIQIQIKWTNTNQIKSNTSRIQTNQIKSNTRRPRNEYK